MVCIVLFSLLLLSNKLRSKQLVLPWCSSKSMSSWLISSCNFSVFSRISLALKHRSKGRLMSLSQSLTSKHDNVVMIM